MLNYRSFPAIAVTTYTTNIEHIMVDSFIVFPDPLRSSEFLETNFTLMFRSHDEDDEDVVGDHDPLQTKKFGRKEYPFSRARNKMSGDFDRKHT